MNLAKSVTQAGQLIRIKMDPKLSDEYCGILDTETHTIHLNPKHCKDEESSYSTVYHELVHHALHVTGISYLLPAGTEETVVRMIENILLPSILRLDRKRHEAK